MGPLAGMMSGLGQMEVDPAYGGGVGYPRLTGGGGGGGSFGGGGGGGGRAGRTASPSSAGSYNMQPVNNNSFGLAMPGKTWEK